MSLGPLQNTLSEAHFPVSGGVNPCGSGRGGPYVDGADDLIDGEREDAEHEAAS